MSRNSRIAKNTLILYGRIVLTAGVSLYTVRIVLGALGMEDYGLYSVIGGVVALLSFLPTAMASATQRYFSHALGAGDRERLKKIFSVNLTVYAVLAVLALLVLETTGKWFVSEHVKIAPDRFEAGLSLYRISVWTFILGILTAPFQAVITAHEDLHLYAGISVAEVLVKLAVALSLAFAPGDRLVNYGWLMLLVAALVAGAYVLTCLRRYEECQFRDYHWDWPLLREVAGFTGWTLFGQVTTVFRNQAVTILMNQSFSPAVVAARAIALNVATQATVFAGNLNTSLYPPIIKSYAAGERKEMYELVFIGSKATFFLMWVFALPLVLQMPLILTLWLKVPPPDTVLFARLALMDALLTALSLPLMTAARAPGRMRAYELSLGSIQLGIFFVTWLVLARGGAAYSVFLIAIGANAIMLGVRLAIVRHLIRISARAFFRRVMLPVSGVAALSLVPSVAVMWLLPAGAGFAILSLAVNFCFAVCAIYFVGIDSGLRLKLNKMVASRFVIIPSRAGL